MIEYTPSIKGAFLKQIVGMASDHVFISTLTRAYRHLKDKMWVVAGMGISSGNPSKYLRNFVHGTLPVVFYF